MERDRVKEAFGKVREDIDFLKNEIGFLKQEISKINEENSKMVEILQKIVENKEKDTSNHNINASTLRHENKTFSTDTSTHNTSFKPLKPQNMVISTRNEGASTDRQTDKQTNRHTSISSGNTPNSPYREVKEQTLPQTEDSLDSIDNAAKILDSLDNVKKEIRKKFKKLTDQEILVFSTLYQLDEEEGHAEYSTIAKKLGLSESSIRDYVSRLIKKGVPVEKTRVNNKFIHLNISKNLKKIASLPTILKLREL